MHTGVAHTHLVEELVGDAGVELCHQRVGVGSRGVALAIEAQQRSTRDELILACIEEVVAQREVVTRGDIPIKTSQNRCGTLLQNLSSIATAIVARKGVETLRDSLGIGLRDVATIVAYIVRRRRRVEVELAIEEEKELVLDYCATQ